MDVSLVIRERLLELGLEQKDLARAARVTESYVSLLLTRKRQPPAPNRTDIYERMDRFLKLPGGELAKLAVAQRRSGLTGEPGERSVPLFQEVRAVVLRKCEPAKEPEIRAIFEKQPFGELERLVTRKLLGVVKGVARDELSNEQWLQRLAHMGGHTFEEMRVIVLEFLDTDLFHVSAEHSDAFLEPLIVSWDINLSTFALDIVLRERVAAERFRRFEFIERPPERRHEEPGFAEFQKNRALSGGATPEELEFLRGLRLGGRRPTALYYYRELQGLRDPLHFNE